MRKNLITIFGETKSVLEWGEDPRCLVSRNGFSKRLKAGWDPEKALATPPAKPGNKKTHPTGTTIEALKNPEILVGKTIAQVAEEVGCSWQAARSAFRQHEVEPVEAVRVWTKQIIRDGKTIDELCEGGDVPADVAMTRIWGGWDIDRALTYPYHPRNPWVAFGETKTFEEWIDDPRCLGTHKSVKYRIEMGMSLEEALQIPVLEYPTLTAFGETKTLGDWVKDDRCVPRLTSTLKRRTGEMGMTPEEAITTQLNHQTSSLEHSIAGFIESLGIEIVRNTRRVIAPKELDIYIPELSTAIEVHGLYWHTERYLPKDYHLGKYFSYKEKGIRLIQIWEDDWNDRTEIVKRMLISKLGLDRGPSVGASRCIIDTVSKSESDIFLDENHIQGPTSATVRLGLRDKKTFELVALALFKRVADSDVDWDLARFATSTRVPGGFSKLLSAFRKTHHGPIKTFADLTISDGGLYESTGWTLNKILPPDYCYLVGQSRVHKFRYRLDRFRSDPELYYEPGMTERELAAVNGLERIYDAGKARYIFK